MFSQVFVCPQGGGSQSLSWGVCVKGGFCLAGSLSGKGGSLSGEGGSLSGRVSVWGSLSRGISVQEGSVWGGSLPREIPPDGDLPYGKERAIRILLECILVLKSQCGISPARIANWMEVQILKANWLFM